MGYRNRLGAAPVNHGTRRVIGMGAFRLAGMLEASQSRWRTVPGVKWKYFSLTEGLEFEAVVMNAWASDGRLNEARSGDGVKPEMRLKVSR